MADYVVRYHPEGWHDAETEPPTTTGLYYVANVKLKDYGLLYWDGKEWFSTIKYPPEEVTHWHDLPILPWEIMPKENVKENK